MYKIVLAERQGCPKGTIIKSRCKPSKNGLQRSFLAPPAGFEPVACRLGGDRSIQLSYGGLYRKYSILQGSRIRTIRFLGGGPSILVRYGGMSLSILPHLSALVNSEKLLTSAARRPHIKNRPRAGLPGAGQNTAGGQRIRSADYVIPYHGIIGKRVLSKNIISARVTKYITSICSINPPKYSESMHITTLYAFCSSFQKKLFQNQLCPRRPDRKTKSPSAKADGLWWGRVDSNHRRHCQQIYSLSPLATREHPRVRFTQRGAGGRTRTPDLLITNQLLYRLSYTSAIPATAIIAKQQPFVNKNLRPAPIFFIQATVPALSSYFS